jgi:hypothetical protein
MLLDVYKWYERVTVQIESQISGFSFFAVVREKNLHTQQCVATMPVKAFSRIITATPHTTRRLGVDCITQ